MRTSIAQSVRKHVQSEGMILPGDCVGVAVSGGADSVALLRILEEVREQLGISLAVVHFDHQLRGEESDGDARFVNELARARGFDLVLERRDVAAEAERNGWNLEDAARRLRYGFFQRLIEDGRVARIAVAQTSDDQAETVLSHIIRGTGPAGLGGIYPIVDAAPGTIVRPLLFLRRGDLRRYLKSAGQSWREDSSNSDLRRGRARIRSRLLPLLEREFSPSIVARLSNLAFLAREEEVFWGVLVEERYKALAQSTAQGILINIPDLVDPLWRLAGGRPMHKANGRWDLNPASRPLTERLIRRLYKEARGTAAGFGADHVERVIRLATLSASGRRVELPKEIRVERVFDQLIFSRADATRSGVTRHETISDGIAYQYMVTLPSRGSDSTIVCVPEVGSRFRLKLIDCAESERETTKDSQTLDADSLRAPLILRNWRPGDAYTPCGRRQPRKLKQMFLAARVPVRQRHHWPVLESAGAVVWARGMPVAEAASARNTTRVGVEIEEEKLHAV